MPSLVQVVKIVHQHSSNKSQVVDIVRKAFAHSHRDWDLLILFVEVVVGVKDVQFTDKGFNVKGLVECAKVIEKAGEDDEELMFEVEAVWNWAK